MQTSNMFTSARTSTTTAAGILSKLATATYQPKWKVEVAEWDPSQDEKVSTTASALWGAVGGEQRVRRTTTAVGWPPAPYSGGVAPAWPPFKNYAWAASRPRGQETSAVDRKRMWDAAYIPLESFNPYDPFNIARREWKEEEEEWVPRNSTSLMEEWEALTESFNPFNPVNVQARADAEAKEREALVNTPSDEPDATEEESHASIRSRAWQRAMARMRPEARRASVSASSIAEAQGEERTPSSKVDDADAPGVGEGEGASLESDGGSDSTSSSCGSSNGSSPWSVADSETYGRPSATPSSPGGEAEYTTWPPKPLGGRIDFGRKNSAPRGIVVEPEEVGWMNFSFLDQV
ncbi:hypothetical protein C8Q79DRAFT_929218 [Trametes meyenii]|nr:hypothetical protein C8Q79DRAFT_929218 [Trametes meyenii]